MVDKTPHPNDSEQMGSKTDKRKRARKKRYQKMLYNLVNGNFSAGGTVMCASLALTS